MPLKLQDEAKPPIVLTDLCRVVTNTGQVRQVESVKEANGLVYIILAETFKQPKMFMPLLPWREESNG